MQTWPKAMTLLSEPRTSKGGEQTVVGSAPIFTSNMPTSDEGRREADVRRFSGQPPVPPPAPLPGTRPPLLTAPPIAPAASGPSVNPGVPLNPPRIGGIESVVGMGPGGAGSGSAAPIVRPAAPAPHVPLTAPSFADRYASDQPQGANSAPPAAAPAPSAAPIAKPQPTSIPLNPLQGAIDLKAREAAATKAAEDQAAAGVKYGDIVQPQASPVRKGPGTTEAIPTTHGTLIPPLQDGDKGPALQQLPKTPAEAETAVAGWRKTQEGWTGSLQAGYQAEQRLNTIADVFKTMQTGYGAEQKAQVAALLKSIGVSLPENILGDPAKVQTAIHENYVETLQQLKATTPRFTQMEFRALSENKEHPDLQPEANLRMLSEDIAQLRQARDLPQDFVAAQQHGWRDPQQFEQAWLRANPLKGYVDKVKKEIGPLKGMEGNEATTRPAAPANGSWTDPKTGKIYQIINGKLHQ
ncbi:MAG TPA: hypothetical protein VJ226_08500 [Bradyrhizobium sp.]|nr:hypothetical protein [Bradyrhizobium sp.]